MDVPAPPAAARPPSRKRTGLLVACGTSAVVLAGAVVAVIVLWGGKGQPDDTANTQPPAQPEPQVAKSQPPLPTPPTAKPQPPQPQLPAPSAADIQSLQADLRSADSAARIRALVKLKAFGPGAAPALDALRDLAQQPDLAVTEHIGIMGALAAIGPDAQPALGLILKALAHRSRSVSSAAERALQKVGVDVAGGKALLKSMMGERGPCDRLRLYKQFGDALLALGPQTKELMDELRAGLRSTNDSVTAACLRVLTPLGRDALPALPDLTALVRRKYRFRSTGDVMRDAITFMGSLGPEAIPVLIEALGRSSLERAAHGALVQIGKPAVPALAQRIESDKEGVGDKAILIVMAIGPDARQAIPALIKAFDDVPRNGNLYHAIGRIGIDADQAKLVATFMVKTDGLRNSNTTYGVAKTCGKVISQLGPKAIAVVGEMRKGLKHPDYSIIVACTKVLKGLGPAAKEAAGDLGELATRESTSPQEVHEAALEALKAMGPAAAEAMPSMIAALSELGLKDLAGDVLVQIGPRAIPALRKALASQHHSGAAARALGRMGKVAKPAVPDLLKAVRQDDWALTEVAARALGLIGDDRPAVVAALRSALMHETAEVAKAAAFGLGDLGAKARPAIPRLKQMVKKHERYSRDAAHAAAAALVKLGQKELGMTFLRRQLNLPDSQGNAEEAAKALAYLGPLAVDAVDDLVRALAVRGTFEQREIIRALRAIGPAAKPAVPALRNLPHDQDFVAEAIAEALAKILPEAPESVDKLVALLKGPDADMRRYAASTIGKRKAEQVAQALPALYKGLTDSDVKVRTECLQALIRIDPEAEKKLPAHAAQIGPLIGVVASRCDDKGYVKWTQFAGGLGASAFSAIRDLHESMLARKSGEPAAAFADALLAMGTDSIAPLTAARRVNTNRNLKTRTLCAVWAYRGKAGVPFLRAILKHSHGDVYRAVEMMVRLGSDAAPAIPELLPLLDKESGLTAERAAEVLGNIGSDDDRVIAALSKALGASDGGLRAHAALALGKIGSRDKIKPILPKLRKLLYSEEAIEVCYAAGALLALKEKDNSCIKLLRQHLTGRASAYAAEACAVAGQAAAPLVPELLAALKKVPREYSQFEESLILALSKAGAPQETFIPLLVERLRRTWGRRVRLQIIRLLKPHVATSREVRNALGMAARGDDAAARKAAAEALKAGRK